MTILGDQKLTRKSTGWYKGCGCGQKQGDLVTPPEGSVEGKGLTRVENYTAPESGLTYEFEPNLIAIDIDPRDVAVLKELGYIADAPLNSGLKGYLARKA